MTPSKDGPFDDKAVTAVKAAITTHAKLYGLESSEPDETGLYHLLYSIMEFCDAHDMNIDDTINAARFDWVETSQERCPAHVPSAV